jgi:hypothetical protein
MTKKVERRCEACGGRGWTTRFLGIGIKNCSTCNGLGKWEEVTEILVADLLLHRSDGEVIGRHRVTRSSRDELRALVNSRNWEGQYKRAWIKDDGGRERLVEVSHYGVEIIDDGDIKG